MNLDQKLDALIAMSIDERKTFLKDDLKKEIESDIIELFLRDEIKKTIKEEIYNKAYLQLGIDMSVPEKSVLKYLFTTHENNFLGALNQLQEISQIIKKNLVIPNNNFRTLFIRKFTDKNYSEHIFNQEKKAIDSISPTPNRNNIVKGILEKEKTQTLKMISQNTADNYIALFAENILLKKEAEEEQGKARARYIDEHCCTNKGYNNSCRCGKRGCPNER